MALVPIDLQPGVVRRGTIYDSKGRWYDSSLARWRDGVPQPWGGWSALTGAGAAQVGGAVRGARAFKRSQGTVYVALGTRTKLYVYSAGTLSDITPAGFTSGALDASGSYYARTEAHSWSLDMFGEDLVGVSYSDGRVVVWDSSAGVGTPAAVATDAPTGCKGVVVTPERFVFALCAGGDRRKVQWADQEQVSGAGVWTPAATNQAESRILPCDGEIMCGRRSVAETLIWTDAELLGARYIGGKYVYSFTPRGLRCGIISRMAVGEFGGKFMWMGTNKFYMYDGSFREVPCTVADYVFNRVNRAQASKIWADVRDDFNEITFWYPSGASTEVDASVTYNWADDHWTLGAGGLVRTAGVDRQGLLEYPILVAADGACYEHEKGTAYTDGGSPYTPYVETGPLELGEGDRFAFIRSVIPDEETLGEVNLTVYTRDYPTASDKTWGPFTLVNPTDVRVHGRSARLRFTQVTAGWRVGKFRVDAVPGSGR